MVDVRRLTLEAVLDDWISDYEMQGDYEDERSLEPPDAYAEMVRQATDWIRRGVLVPGQMLENGFVPWSGSAEENARQFAEMAQDRTTLALPGQIAWFDTGPQVEQELAKLNS
jgi:hypothetical protein